MPLCLRGNRSLVAPSFVGQQINRVSSHNQKISTNVTPTCWELFQKTHKITNGDRWVSSKT
ncbi:hypothetical protein Fmac_005384 [Flemingia macrophylla]|uniref:Uncharacterized protein n=1 Tax=Flemingia macrophylla TaxID=520843 RepID=A0ABD1N7S2_9FABA